MPAGGGTTRGRRQTLARTPYHAPRPAPANYQGPPRTSYGAAQRAQQRAVPRRPAPKPVSRPAASRENRPNAVAVSPANRIALLQRVLAAYSPPPSPDRTTGREQAGFASSAFTGKGPFGDAANGFFPDAAGAKDRFDALNAHKGYGMQAGNPAQQAIAAKNAEQTGSNTDLVSAGQAVEKALRRAIAGSPVGAGVGNVIGTQTWDKLAPLFARSSKDMPQTSFGGTGKFAGYASDGKVKIDPGQLQDLFSRNAGTRSVAAKGLRGLLAHEYSHTQQKGGGQQLPFKDRSMGTYNPRLEGGADAFEGAVAPLLGYRAQSPDPRGEYGRAQIKFGKDLRKVLINQFPRVYKQRTPVTQQRVNLSQ